MFTNFDVDVFFWFFRFFFPLYSGNIGLLFKHISFSDIYSRFQMWTCGSSVQLYLRQFCLHYIIMQPIFGTIIPLLVLNL